MRSSISWIECKEYLNNLYGLSIKGNLHSYSTPILIIPGSKTVIISCHFLLDLLLPSQLCPTRGHISLSSDIPQSSAMLFLSPPPPPLPSFLFPSGVHLRVLSGIYPQGYVSTLMYNQLTLNCGNSV